MVSKLKHFTNHYGNDSKLIFTFSHSLFCCSGLFFTWDCHELVSDSCPVNPPGNQHKQGVPKEDHKELSQKFHLPLGWFLFWWKLKFQLLHGFKLFHFVHRFWNTFWFRCRTTPSAVRNFFSTTIIVVQWEFQWENVQNQSNGQKSFSRSDLGSYNV